MRSFLFTLLALICFSAFGVHAPSPSGRAQVLEEGAEIDNPYGGTLYGQLLRVYNWGLNLISQEQTDPNNYGADMTNSYYGYDGHGNVRFLMDANGNITDTYMYDAFGSLVASSNNTPNVYLYSGQRFDPDLGLYYNRARYLSTDLGRFWTMDSYGGNNEDPLSLHKYLYAQDDPVNMSDPSGNIPILSNWQWGTAVHDKIAEDFKYNTISLAPRVGEIPISQILGVPWNPGGSASIPDLVQYPNGELPGQVYEIKPEGSWIQGRVQLYWYLGLLNGLDPQKRKWAVGSVFNYTPPPVIELSPTVYAIVSPPLDGVILYHVEDFGLDAVVVATYMTADLAASLSVATLDEALAY